MEFQQNLDSVIAEWNSRQLEDEWLFDKFRECQIREMSPEEAWSQIGLTLPKLIDAINENTATEILETMLALARKSMTTDLPPEIASSCDLLAKQFSKYSDYSQGQLRLLFRHYRIQHPFT